MNELFGTAVYVFVGCMTFKGNLTSLAIGQGIVYTVLEASSDRYAGHLLDNYFPCV